MPSETPRDMSTALDNILRRWQSWARLAVAHIPSAAPMVREQYDALLTDTAIVRAAHQERDADARRLARRLANATPPSLDYPNGYTRLAERFHAILTDAAMAADTQTEGESDGAQ